MRMLAQFDRWLTCNWFMQWNVFEIINLTHVWWPILLAFGKFQMPHFAHGPIFNFAFYTFQSSSVCLFVCLFHNVVVVKLVQFFNTFTSFRCFMFSVVWFCMFDGVIWTVRLQHNQKRTNLKWVFLFHFLFFPDFIFDSIFCAFLSFSFLSANFFHDKGGMARACGNASASQECPTNFICLQGDNLNPNYGITSFDTIFRSFFVVFRIVQRDFWEETMQYVTATAGPIHILLFVVLIFYISFQLSSLLWTPIALAYNYLKDAQWESDLLKDLNEVSLLEIVAVLLRCNLAAARLWLIAHYFFDFGIDVTSILVKMFVMKIQTIF